MERVMIQRMSNQGKISFLEGEKSSNVQKSSNAKPERTMAQLAEQQKAKKLENKDNGLMTNHTITSATTGVIRDEGGPSKYIKSESSNSIFDSGKTARESEKLDSKTKSRQDKEYIVANKRDAEQKRMDSLVEALKRTDQTKASAVSPAVPYSGTNYMKPIGSMSIFDTKDFQRLADKTGGEQVTEDKKERNNQVDDSWRGGGKSVTSSDLKDRFFNSLLQKRDK